MDNTKEYIIKKNTEYGYEIYLISDEKRTKYEGKNKIIMNRVLKKFPYRETQNGNYKYTNLKLISLYYEREKLKQIKKRVNRNKSKKIVTTIIVGAAILIGATSAYHHFKNEDKEQSSINIESQIINNPNIGDDNENDKPIEEINIKIPQKTEFVEKEPNVFYYEYDTPGDKEAIENATQYMNIFKKYERIYGVDANLLCAICAQESSGKHVSYSQNGHATGAMQVENIWADVEFRVFNYEKNDYETIKVDYSRIGELDYNIKIGAAILQWTINYFEEKYPNLNEEEKIAFYIQAYNYGASFMNQAIQKGSDYYKENDNQEPLWMFGRQFVKAGDSKYFEHVVSRLPNGTIITIKLQNGDTIENVIVNTALEKTHSR